MPKHAQVENTLTNGHFIDIFPHETNSFYFYEMQRNIFRHLKKYEIYTYIFAYIRLLNSSSCLAFISIFKI